MKEWKYLIGSSDDFIGAPEWATLRTFTGGRYFFAEHNDIGSRVLDIEENDEFEVKSDPTGIQIVAKRAESFGNAIDLEFCKANPDHPDCKCKEESKVADTNIGTLTYKVGFDLSEISGQSQAEMKEVISSTVKTFFDDTVCRAMTREAVAMALEAYKSKYSRPCKGITLDVYDVLQAFAVTNPATQHAIKKLLCAGLRGHKDKMQDLTEALKSIERAIELEKE